MKPRYLRIRLEKPAEPWRFQADARVHVIGKRGQLVDITGTVPASFAGSFWAARAGDRIPGHLFVMPARVRAHGRCAPRLVTRRVVFRFAEIVPRRTA